MLIVHSPGVVVLSRCTTAHSPHTPSAAIRRAAAAHNNWYMHSQLQSHLGFHGHGLQPAQAQQLPSLLQLAPQQQRRRRRRHQQPQPQQQQRAYAAAAAAAATHHQHHHQHHQHDAPTTSWPQAARRAQQDAGSGGDDGEGSYAAGRLVIKRSSRQQQQHPQQQQAARVHPLDQVLPGSLRQLQDAQAPRGTVSIEQQQQAAAAGAAWPARPPQSLRDKNMSFSGALRQAKTLAALLELLHNPQWGAGLCDLDAVSVVGALVSLSKSDEWQQLQRQGSAGQRQWRLQQQGEALTQQLLDRAEALVMPQALPGGGSNSSGGVPAAAGAGGTSPLMRPAELANLIYATSKLRQQRPQLLAAAAAALSLDLYACSSTELNRLIWGLASGSVNPGDPWLLNFCKAAQAKFLQATASELTTIVYGVARLGYRPPDVWTAGWLQAALPLLETFSARNLANAAWGLSVFRFAAPPSWMGAFYAASARVLHDLAPPGVSQLCQAVVVLGGGQPPPEAWTQQLLAAARPLFGTMELLQLCNLGWALGSWQHCPDAAIVAEWLDACVPLLPAATPVDLSVLLWACDKLHYVPQQRWLEAWFTAAGPSLPRCEPQQLATIAVVLGNWGLVPVKGFSIDYWRASKAKLASFTPYQLSLLMLGLGKARRSVPETWATAVLDTFTARLLHQADPGDVCRLIGACGLVVVKPHGSKAWVQQHPAVQAQLQQCVVWLLPQLAALEPPWLVLLVRGLVRLGCSLEHAQVQELWGALTAMDDRVALKHRKVLTQSLKELGELAH